MKRFITIVAAIALVLGVGSAAYANMCATDTVPAATILYPFVQYNYADPNVNTLFAVTNVSNEAVIVHFTLWTDYSIHVVDWNVVLSGYDVQTFSIRDIIGPNGQLPSTGTGSNPNFGSQGEIGVDEEHASVDQVDGIGPVPHALNPSQGTTALYDRCNTGFEAYPNYPPFPANFLTFMQGLLTPSQTVSRVHLDCNGTEQIYGDWFEQRDLTDPTWMYITADVVYACNKMFPDSQTNYWVAGITNSVATPAQIENGPQAMYDNVLIGDIFYINDAANFSEALNAVSLEADPYYAFVRASDGNPLTFYHQYVMSTGAGYSPVTMVPPAGSGDYREPLPTAWAFRYLNRGVAMNTDIRVFKRATLDYGYVSVQDLISNAAADSAPSYMKADDTIPYSLYFWDENEEAILWTGSSPPWSPSPKFCRINLFPLETQSVSIDQFPLTFPSGWGLLVYPPSTTNTGGTNGGEPDYYQVYVSVRHGAMNKYSAALPGAVLANANCYPDQILPDLWSASVGAGE